MREAPGAGRRRSRDCDESARGRDNRARRGPSGGCDETQRDQGQCRAPITAPSASGAASARARARPAARGGKGQTARTGVALNGFEGGQTPLHRRLPKRGFNNKMFRKAFPYRQSRPPPAGARCRQAQGRRAGRWRSAGRGRRAAPARRRRAAAWPRANSRRRSPSRWPARPRPRSRRSKRLGGKVIRAPASRENRRRGKRRKPAQAGSAGVAAGRTQWRQPPNNSPPSINFSAFAKATDLKNRIWFTLGALVIYRLGTYIPLPGIDPQVLRRSLPAAIPAAFSACSTCSRAARSGA